MAPIEEIRRFTTGNKKMVIIKTGGGASVLDFEEYKKLLKMYNRQKRH